MPEWIPPILNTLLLLGLGAVGWIVRTARSEMKTELKEGLARVQAELAFLTREVKITNGTLKETTALVHAYKRQSEAQDQQNREDFKDLRDRKP